MVKLGLSEKHLESVKELTSLDETAVEQLCQAVAESVSQSKEAASSNTKMLSILSKRLNLDQEDLNDLLELILWLFLEFSRLSLSQEEIVETLHALEIKSAALGKMLSSSGLGGLESYVNALRLKCPSFSNLEWRIDVSLASRAVRHLVEPELVVKLELDSQQKQQTVLLKMDPVNLTNLTTGLEEALMTLRSGYFRKVHHSITN